MYSSNYLLDYHFWEEIIKLYTDFLLYSSSLMPILCIVTTITAYLGRGGNAKEVAEVKRNASVV
jgi:hypothetical protein